MKENLKCKQSTKNRELENQFQILDSEWGVFKPLIKAELEIFNAALEGLMNLRFVPREVSHRRKSEQSGISYCYKCSVSMTAERDDLGLNAEVYVEVYKPLKKMKPIITDVIRK